MSLKTYVAVNKHGTEVRYTQMDGFFEIQGNVPASIVGTKIPLEVCHLIYKVMEQVYDLPG